MKQHRSTLVAAGLALLAACTDAGTGPAGPSLSVSPGPKIVINEVMADPTKVTDDNGEWMEIHNWGSSSIDLKGWKLASGNDAAHTIATTLTVPAGGFVVLARNGNKSKNGGVTVQYAYGTALTLANGGDWISLKDAAGATVDSVAWTGTTAGASRGVKDPSADNLAVGGANWQTATTAYNTSDKGTPGAQNDGYVAPVQQPATVTVTPGAATIAVGGTQAFTATALDAWGDPVTTTFTWTTSDAAVATVSASGVATGVANGTAQIRATASNGVFAEAALTVSTAAVAKLLINELMPNPSAVTDDAGEWVEVHNWGNASADLKGYVIASNNDAGHTIASSVIVPADGYVVLARNGNSGQNGGVLAHYAYGTAVTLANSADWVALRAPSGATVDSVAWSSVPTGASRGVADPAAANTDMGGSNWTTQTSLYGSGDKGTPGGRNDGYVSPVPPGPPATVTVTPSSATVTVGGTYLFAASAVDSAGRTTSTTYTWSSSDAAVATMGADGRATGVAAGTAAVRATASNGVFGEAAVTVVVEPTGGGASELVVRVLDIGQGDANLITNGTSKVIIDGGPDSVRFGVLLDSLGLNNTTIDVVILSHEHYDHHSGLRELFRASRNITVRYFFENKNAYSNAALAQLRDSVSARAARGELVYRDTDDPCANGAVLCTITMNGGAKLHVMRPNPAGSTPNNRSTPVKLVGPDSASFSMWFAGDAEHEAIDWFDTGANYDVFPGMDVDVLKADHHGSCNGVRSRYVEMLTPDWVTFSLLADNSYGHVHTQTKELFTQYGRPWYRTDQNGTITIRTPGTPGGGYTISVTRGTQNASGPADRASTQTACQAL
ncbi:MAG: lamin tail domain-containing protein [Gemmatimonadetes bacterium]|nr:lamin tail domain-containing protein [Gemmatimonadota bacterium]